MKTFIYCFFFFIGLFAQAFETQAQPEIWYEGDNCLEESSWFILHRSGMSVTIMGWRVTGNFSYVYEPQPGTDIIEVMWHEPGTYRVEVDYIPYNQWDFVTLSYDITIVNRTLTSVSLSGPSSIMKGQSATYIATGSLSGGNYSFYVNNNWIQNTTPNSFTTTTLNNGDVVKVVFFPNRPCTSYSETSMQIIVNETSTQAPRVPSVSTNNCGPKTLTATGSPSGNIRWYWQGTNAGGQSTALPATVPYIATSSGTYYIKAVNNPGTWSSATPVNVIVNDPPPPAANNYTFCEWDEMRLTTSGVPLNGTLKWYNTADQLVYTGVSYLVNHKAGSYTYRVRSVGNSDCQSATYATVTVQVNISCDQYLNWQESTQYTIDNGGNPVPAASSKSYADAFGKPLQTQGRSLSTNQVLAAQPVKNQFGELALQSLAAPISSASFGYRHNFMTNEGGTKYGANDFDLRSLPPGGGGVTTGVNLISASTDASNADGFKPSGPVLISAVSQNGQTYVKVVATSYSETPGAWPIGSGSGSYIVTPGASYTLRVKGYRDTPGAVYLYARSAVGTQQNIVWPGASLPLGAQNEGWSQNAIVVPEDVNEITVGVLFSIPSVGSTFYINDIELWDSRTGMVMSPKQVANGGPGTLGWYYSTANTLEPQTPVTKYPYSRSFIPEGPDPKTSSAARPGDQHYMGSGHNVNTRRELIAPGDLSTHLSMRSQFVPGAANAIAGYKYITTNPDGKKSIVFEDLEGAVLASATLNPTPDNWSFSFYNDMGQLVATVPPQGVADNNVAYATTYSYDHLGNVIKVTSPDEGTVRYVYSFDGKLRFSQNDEQANATPKRFSYTNYDKLGRVIEVGEYTCRTDVANGTLYQFDFLSSTTTVTNSILDIADFTGLTGISKSLDPDRCAYHTYIEYDLPGTAFVADASHGEPGNLHDQVSKTENEHAATWYSYDEFGRLAWSKQYIIDLQLYKTVDYTYDFSGNVTQVIYQKDAADKFYHSYVYDADQRLTEVKTSTNGTSFTTRARYSYYLHGPLKRITLVNGETKVQGLDYVYTIDGALKAINNADNTRDPGNDGDDIFGETLTYHDNDYQGANYAEATPGFAAYTNQFSGALKGVAWHSPADNQVNKNAYAFTYDQRYQLSQADFGTVTGTSAYTFTAQPGVQKESVSLYDKNGNIKALQRTGKTGNSLANFTYNYTANTNQLLSVADNGTPKLNYQYNAIGQMIRQTEGATVTQVRYNAYGLVENVRDGEGDLLQEYVYDDRGNRIIKRIYDNGVLQKSEYTIYDASGTAMALYEKIGIAIQLTEVPVYGMGRIAVFKPQVSTCFYEVSDHLGSVRGVIGVPETQQFSASFEDNTYQSEVQAFDNYNRVDRDMFDHTDEETLQHYAQLLNGGNGRQVGLARSFKVSPGDKITAEVFAKYQALSGETSNVTGFAAALTSAFGLSSGMGIDGAKAYEVLDTYGSIVAAGNGPGDEDSGIKAFITVLLVDNNFNLVDAAWDQLDESAEQEVVQEKAAHDHLYREVTVREPGYAYVFVSNEHSTMVDVYFDDLMVTHQLSPIVAGADYYPFGMTMDGREITQEAYRHGYQGQFSQKDSTTGYNEFRLRFYDAKIGRWLNSDPYGQYYSPYMAMSNSPQASVDPTGGWGLNSVATGALIGAAVGTGVGLLVDPDHWYYYTAGGAALGAVGGAAYNHYSSLSVPGIGRYGPDPKYIRPKGFTASNTGIVSPLMTNSQPLASASNILLSLYSGSISQPSSSVIDVVWISRNLRLNHFRETVMYGNSISFTRYTYDVFVEFDKTFNIKKQSGFGRVVIKGESGETSSYTKLHISRKMEEFISLIHKSHKGEFIGNQQSLIKKYTDYIFSQDENGKDAFGRPKKKNKLKTVSSSGSR